MVLDYIKFMNGDRVNIKLPNIEGIIIGCFCSNNYITYSVAYWHNGERYVETLIEHEIEAINETQDNTRIGFCNEN